MKDGSISTDLQNNVVGKTNRMVSQEVNFKFDFAFKVKSIRLKARDSHPDKAIVCFEIKLFIINTPLRHVNGWVTTAASNYSKDWRMLDDYSNGNNSMVHTDGTTPDNSIILIYGDV